MARVYHLNKTECNGHRLRTRL